MDMIKIGSFLKELRKERGLTQEQLAEAFGVAGRTVSRWETAINMPDLSILIQLAEFYEVDVSEILDGERRDSKMDKEIKETLTKVADYNEEKNNKFAAVCRSAMLITLVLCAVAIVVQLVVFGDISYVVSETVAVLVGGFAAIGMTVKNGLWDFFAKQKATPLRDFATSSIISLLFSVAVFAVVYTRTQRPELATVFSSAFFVVISAAGFAVLRILSKISKNNQR